MEKSLVNGFREKECAKQEMKKYAARAKEELDYDNPIIKETQDSCYITNDSCNYYYYKIETIKLK